MNAILSNNSSKKRNDLLKVFAMLTMLIDHAGAILFPQLRLLRFIGRLAFPVFCYQIAVGYEKTSNRDGYLLRILKFACIAQIPYWFLNPNTALENPLHFNVLFLLALGIVMLNAFTKFKKAYENKSISFLLYLFLFVLIIISPDLLTLFIPDFTLSYGTYGLLLIFGFYLSKDNMIKMFVFYLIITFICTYTSVALYNSSHEYWLIDRLNAFSRLMKNPKFVFDTISKYNRGRFLEGYLFQARSILSLFFIWFFNKFKSSFRLNRYVGYWFYPVHIALLELINVIINH